jgi:hypothetical protein
MEQHENDFVPHEMMDPMSGKIVAVTSEEQHLALEEMGFTMHTDGEPRVTFRPQDGDAGDY